MGFLAGEACEILYGHRRDSKQTLEILVQPRREPNETDFGEIAIGTILLDNVLDYNFTDAELPLTDLSGKYHLGTVRLTCISQPSREPSKDILTNGKLDLVERNKTCKPEIKEAPETSSRHPSRLVSKKGGARRRITKIAKHVIQKREESKDCQSSSASSFKKRPNLYAAEEPTQIQTIFGASKVS